MANGTTDNTAVNRLIDLAQQRPVEADDTLFETPKRIPLPPPFRARGASTKHSVATAKNSPTLVAP